jgi:hypothetical protein
MYIHIVQNYHTRRQEYSAEPGHDVLPWRCTQCRTPGYSIKRNSIPRIEAPTPYMMHGTKFIPPQFRTI